MSGQWPSTLTWPDDGLAENQRHVWHRKEESVVDQFRRPMLFARLNITSAELHTYLAKLTYGQRSFWKCLTANHYIVCMSVYNIAMFTTKRLTTSNRSRVSIRVTKIFGYGWGGGVLDPVKFSSHHLAWSPCKIWLLLCYFSYCVRARRRYQKLGYATAPPFMVGGLKVPDILGLLRARIQYEKKSFA